ncbi:BTAD domain-containing putative transcriptional regulator [Streptomyces sp. NBC_01443]|uniref:AfsR/SARP family transcriptional regulator n=1 Tax=Streptomyces sp. NBC_01443 TaxID=2903868 RepID=UPI002259C191|nr:BTAD domain-containing putative transcriptional regulator [Streptomyces sp. NBC_01443]MCX4625779.1 tetratricopeptide repeat protein [Streptomyces sp. NBC_01443]
MDGESPQRLRIALLGPVRAWRGTTPVDLGPVRRQAVLAVMALRPGTSVSHEDLLDGVWGAALPGSGRRVLPSYVFALRKALDLEGTGLEHSVIRSSQGRYGIAVDGIRIDVAELAEQVQDAQRAKASGDVVTAMARLTDALALFRGEPLAGLPGPFAQAERRRLAEQRITLQSERLECLVLSGRAAEALDGLAALSASAPYDEALLALHMRALYAGQRQAEALNAYQGMRERLRDELGVSPGAALSQVYEAVLRRDDERLLGPAAARPAALPVPLRPRPPVNELPGVTGVLIGRERERALLATPSPADSVGVAAVDGIAGVGKTALVVRAAQELRSRYPDGCLFVDLRAHSPGRQKLSPQRVLRRLLRSTGTADSEVPADLDELTAAWRAATGSLRLLLVLDDALGSTQIRPLLPAGPGSMVIVASRQRLAGLDADRRITLEPLETGDAESLLEHLVGEERATGEREAARELVRLCGGLPLALRIAGTRLQTRPAWTLAHLVHRMADDDHRLGELSAGDRSLEAAFRLSYDQLAPPQQRGFRTLGLAPTAEVDVLTSAAMLGRPAREAEQILEGLVDTSLLQEPRPGRYRLHDLVRVHARRLAEATPAEAGAARTAALRLHLDAARTASDWGPAGFPTGPLPTAGPFADRVDANAWLDAATSELADVVGYAAGLGEADYACWIAEALTDHFLRRGRYHEGRAALEAALPQADRATDRRMVPALRNCMGIIDIYQGNAVRAHATFTEALRLSRQCADRHEEARALSGLGAAELNSGRSDQALSPLAAAVDLARLLDDDWLVSMTLCVLGTAHRMLGQTRDALLCLTEATARAEANGRPTMISRALSCAADVLLDLGRFTEAKELLRRAADLMQQAGDVPMTAILLSLLGTAELGLGNPEAAMALQHEALSRQQLLSPLNEPHYTRMEMAIRGRLGRAYSAAGRVPEARMQFRTVLAIPGGDAYPAERELAIAGLRDCESS